MKPVILQTQCCFQCTHPDWYPRWCLEKQECVSAFVFHFQGPGEEPCSSAQESAGDLNPQPSGQRSGVRRLTHRGGPSPLQAAPPRRIAFPSTLTRHRPTHGSGHLTRHLSSAPPCPPSHRRKRSPVKINYRSLSPGSSGAPPRP